MAEHGPQKVQHQRHIIATHRVQSPHNGPCQHVGVGVGAVPPGVSIRAGEGRRLNKDGGHGGAAVEGLAREGGAEADHGGHVEGVLAEDIVDLRYT